MDLAALLPIRLQRQGRLDSIPDYGTTTISRERMGVGIAGWDEFQDAHARVYPVVATEMFFQVLVVRGMTSPVEDARLTQPTGSPKALMFQRWLNEKHIRVGSIDFSGPFTTRR